jgi:hypothetical protein
LELLDLGLELGTLDVLPLSLGRLMIGNFDKRASWANSAIQRQIYVYLHFLIDYYNPAVVMS